MRGTGVESTGLFKGTIGARAMDEESVKDEVESDAFKTVVREAGRQFAIGFMEAVCDAYVRWYERSDEEEV